ncbi:inositol monophosphatase [Nocardioides sp. C4-1]|uniref:inositol monophosphatase family protein n=1 Tax=Nocardioides sp. C4-1 TaxID=3151851 RepID=UPI003267F75A
METDDVSTLLREVAAEVITPRFRSLDADEIAEKNPGDLVTIADREAEVLITEALSAAYPDAVVLGEEATSVDASVLDRYADAAHAFTVDPVDGTKNFVHGSPDHAVMAAELREGVVVRSWIWQPQHERMYVAELGAGAFRNGERLTRTPAGAPSTWRGATSRRRWLGRSLPGHAPLELTWVSCGIDYPHLVEGDADYLLYSRTMPWDHAPGRLLLTEAGGALRLLDAHDYDPTRIHDVGLVAAADREVADAVVADWDRLA